MVTVESMRRQVGTKKETRTLNISWYKDYRWIHECISRKRVFCYYCLQYSQNGGPQFTKTYDSAFMQDGFQNWKKGPERLERHEKSECHREALHKLNTCSLQGPSVITQLNSEARRTQAVHRRMLITHQCKRRSVVLRSH